MAPKDIKTGDAVVAEFLDTLESTDTLDEESINAIKRLYADDKLTTTKLEQALTLLRQTEARQTETSLEDDRLED